VGNSYPDCRLLRKDVAVDVEGCWGWSFIASLFVVARCVQKKVNVAIFLLNIKISKSVVCVCVFSYPNFLALWFTVRD
jgi:hypothetical protein